MVKPAYKLAPITKFMYKIGRMRIVRDKQDKQRRIRTIVIEVEGSYFFLGNIKSWRINYIEVLQETNEVVIELMKKMRDWIYYIEYHIKLK